MQRLILLLCPLILLGLALNGCAEFQDRPLQPEVSQTRLEARSLTSHELQSFMQSVSGSAVLWPFKRWNIDQLTLVAIYYHPDMALIRAMADTADAAIITAGQRPNPTLNVSPTWISNAVAASQPWIIGSSLSIPIETAGKRDYRIQKAQALSDAAHLRSVDSIWLVRGRIRLAMLEVFAARQSEQLFKQQLDIQLAMTQRLQQQLAAGELSRLDVMRARMASNALQLNVSAAEKRYNESRVLLANAMGVPVSALAAIELDFAALDKPAELTGVPVQVLRDIALKQRADLLAALADYNAAQAALQIEIANQYPNIQANPGYTWDIGAHYWTFAASALQLPVFHQNQGSIAEAEAKRQEMAVRFEALQLRILGDIDRAQAGLSAVNAKWQDAEKQTRLQQDNLQATQALFQAGETDSLALLGAELEGIVSATARLNVLIETQQALNVLEDTLRYPLASTLTAKSIVDTALWKKPE